MNKEIIVLPENKSRLNIQHNKLVIILILTSISLLQGWHPLATP
jgi:hypothetical protein